METIFAAQLWLIAVFLVGNDRPGRNIAPNDGNLAIDRPGANADCSKPVPACVANLELFVFPQVLGFCDVYQVLQQAFRVAAGP